MIWLAIDTSGATSAVAITKDKDVVAELTVLRDRRHSEQLIYHIDAALRLAGLSKKEVEGVAVSAGPGSFTGLRIGLATAKALAFAWQVPLVGVNTLTALLYGHRPSPVPVCALVDAQKQKVYYSIGYWHNGELECTSYSRIAPLTDVLTEIDRMGRPTVCTGEVAAMFAAEIEAHPYAYLAPAYRLSVRAASVAALAEEKYLTSGSDDVYTLAPNYLRKSEAELLWEARQCKK